MTAPWRWMLLSGLLAEVGVAALYAAQHRDDAWNDFVSRHCPPSPVPIPPLPHSHLLAWTTIVTAGLTALCLFAGVTVAVFRTLRVPSIATRVAVSAGAVIGVLAAAVAIPIGLAAVIRLLDPEIKSMSTLALWWLLVIGALGALGWRRRWRPGAQSRPSRSSV